jgi:Fic family protein
MSDRTAHGQQQHARAEPKHEPQILTSDELIVYEAVATFRGPMEVGEVVGKTGLDEDTVRAALDHLTALDMVETDERGTRIGPNDWDVRGVRQ